MSENLSDRLQVAITRIFVADTQLYQVGRKSSLLFKYLNTLKPILRSYSGSKVPANHFGLVRDQPIDLLSP